MTLLGHSNADISIKTIPFWLIFTKWWLIKHRCILHFELWKTDYHSKTYANLSNDRARMGKFFLQRRTILCNHSPDLPIALVTILFYGNKTNTNIFKEVWDVAVFICSSKYKCQEPIHVVFQCNAQHVHCFLHFFVRSHSNKLQKYTNHNVKFFFFMLGLLYHWIQSNSERGALKGKRDSWKNWFCDDETKLGK